MPTISEEMNRGVTVTVTRRMNGEWSEMSDEEIINFIREDISVLTDGAHWTIQRT